MATTTKSDLDDPELVCLLEAARRATWDALHGPVHLRSGRFYPSDEDGAHADKAAQQGAAAAERRNGDRG